MTENEQINKIAREICHLRAEYITCEECNKECCIDEDELCYFQCMAKEIISHNYRKASEVAREIFEEVKKQQYTIYDWHEVVDIDEVAEIIKRYTEVTNNDGE